MKISFEPWGEIPESSDLDKRLKSASSAKLTPIEIDRENKTAIFAGSTSIYQTSLRTCNCPDYSINRNKRNYLPCKHILRLAMNLGLLKYPYKEDASAIKDPRDKIPDPLAPAVAALEEYPEFMERIRFIMSGHQQKTPRFVEDIDSYQFFIDNGLLVRAEPDYNSVFLPPQKECIDTLEKYGFSFPSELVYKKDKYAYANAHKSEVLHILYPNSGYIDTGDNINNCFVNLQTYLSYRLNHYESAFDPESMEETQEPRDIGDLKSSEVKELLLKYDPFYKDHNKGTGFSFKLVADFPNIEK